MYKKRLKKWRIGKRTYRKSQVTNATVSPESALDATGSDSMGIEEILRTPPSTVSIIQPSNPEAFDSLQIVLGSVFSWSQGKLDSQSIILDPMSRYLASPNQPPIQDSRTMYRTFELMFDLWRHGKGNLAGMAARKGFYVLEYVLTEDHPDLVWHILDTIYDMVDRGHLQLLGMFLEHATALAHRQLPAQHPLFRIFQQLKRCDYYTDQGRQYVCHLLRQAWLRNVHLLGEHIGSLTPQHLWLYEQLIWDGRTRLRKNSDLGRRREAMEGALEALQVTQDQNSDEPNSERLRVEALILEFTQMDLRDKPKAEQLALKLLQSTACSERGSRSDARFHAYARKMLARIHQDRHDWDIAEQNLKLAIRNRECAHGTGNNIRVVRDMWVLAAHFRRVGRKEDAEKVINAAIERAQRYLEDIPG